MRKLLLLALLLYDIIVAARFYDYDDAQAKKHGQLEDRRNWRKKTLEQNFDHKEWEDKRRELDVGRYSEVDRQMDVERSRDTPVEESKYRRDSDRVRTKSSEMFYDKEIETPKHKPGPEKDIDKSILNCDRDHERYEACFSGCAAVSCDNPRDRLRPCYPFCEPGCVCTAPYVRDDRTHKCVLPDECSKGLKGIPDLGDIDDTHSR